MRKMFCPYCGKPVELDESYPTAFCPYCGKPLPLTETQNPPPPPPAPETRPPRSAPRPQAAPVIEEKVPVRHRANAAGSGARGMNFVSSPRGARRRTLPGWYAAVAAWALAFALVYLACGAADLLYLPTVSLTLLFLGSFPLWFPRFHPWRSDPDRRRGVWLRWALIMAAILVLILLLGAVVF